MTTALLAALLAVLPALSMGAQESRPPAQNTTPASTPQESAPAKPPADQKPISLSPVMPVDQPDPAVMAARQGAKPAGAPVGETYVIGPEDVLGVKVWENAQLNGTYSVLPDGNISIPLLGPVKADGLTPVELESSINKAAEKFLQVAHSAVQVEQVRSKKIYFDGDGIANPGEMPYIMPLHLFEAISARGGFKDFADKKHIKVIRAGTPTVTVSYNDLLSGKHPEKNVLLKANDHVWVK